MTTLSAGRLCVHAVTRNTFSASDTKPREGEGGTRETRVRKRGMTPIMHRTSGEFVMARIVTECNNEGRRRAYLADDGGRNC